MGVTCRAEIQLALEIFLTFTVGGFGLRLAIQLNRFSGTTKAFKSNTAVEQQVLQDALELATGILDAPNAASIPSRRNSVATQ
eukprot:1065826-Amorphochlora_amoeboformis.AAC.1